jgi:hypothetical protein
MKFIILSESLASALKKYGDTVDVEAYAEADPTPTKKYVEFLCKHNDDILEMYEGTDDYDVMYDIIEYILKEFNKISKNLPKKDINQYKKWDDVVIAIEEYETRKDKRNPIKKIHPESEVIFEDKDIIVIRVDSWEASRQYGAGKFCIAAEDTDYWYQYTENGGKFFYIFKKNNIHRPYVIEVRAEKKSISFYAWNYLNDPINAIRLMGDFGITKNLLIKQYQKHPPEDIDTNWEDIKDGIQL